MAARSGAREISQVTRSHDDKCEISRLTGRRNSRVPLEGVEPLQGSLAGPVVHVVLALAFANAQIGRRRRTSAVQSGMHV